MPNPPPSTTAYVQGPIVDSDGRPTRAFLKVLQQWGEQLRKTPTTITFSDISGTLTIAQLPASAPTVEITTAKLTPGGTEGSMEFTNGLLTSFTAAT